MIVVKRPPEAVHDGEQEVKAFWDAVGANADFVRQSLHGAFAARAVVALDVDDDRVVQFAAVFNSLDDPPDVGIAIGQAAGIDFHHVGIELMLVGAQ